MKKMMKTKKLVAIFMAVAMSICCVACGSGESKNSSVEGELTDIMTKLYADMDVDAETKGAIQGYVSENITAENEEYILGVTGLPYTEGIYSVPAMTSVAYQCVLLRVNPEDVETVKAALLENANPDKWVCVSAEAVLAENVGDLVLFIMSTEDVAYAISSVFQSLK